MEIRRVQTEELSSAYELLAQNGWRDRLENLERFVQLVEASQLAEVAVTEGQIVGFLRGITDGLSNGYLSMVVVAPSHRGRGIGRKLVEHAVGSNPQVTWVLRAGRAGANEFFAKLGFEHASLAMERRRA
ncbi:MAG: GNAT family N-acetyltransferase [Rhizobacter sp.]|nr:GNAT family N-acetyltransferase [Rhizobacter sp.]